MKKLSGAGAEKVIDLLTEPLKTFSLQVLDMEQYPILLDYLKFDTRKQFGLNVISVVTTDDIALTSVESVDSLLKFLEVLIKDVDDTPGDEKKNKENFAYEQREVTRLVHQIKAATPDDHMQMLNTVRGHFGTGGSERIGYTLPSVVYSALSLIESINAYNQKRAELEEAGEEAPEPLQVTVKKAFQFVHKTTSKLSSEAPDAALQLWLVSASLANKHDVEGNFEPICYEFLTQALVVFEEEITDSKKQYEALFLLIGCIVGLYCLDEENRETIVGKLVQHSAKLLKKPMQCRAVSACAALFVGVDSAKVIQCLQKALKIVDAAVQQNPKDVELWVDMLDKYVYFLEKDVETVTAKFITSLVNLCPEHIEFAMGTAEAKAEAQKASVHYQQTLKYIRKLQKEDPGKYGEITV